MITRLGPRAVVASSLLATTLVLVSDSAATESRRAECPQNQCTPYWSCGFDPYQVCYEIAENHPGCFSTLHFAMCSTTLGCGTEVGVLCYWGD
jgi:hypothetical protein